VIDKKVLRARLRAERDAFAAKAPCPIVADTRFTDRLRPDMIVATYAPLGSEADPRHLAEAAERVGCGLALPHVVDRATPLRFLAWDGYAALAPGPYGLANPQSGWEEITPDVILTPLLGFDADLNRLGQGAGHYDRAFAASPDAWRVGVAWSVQKVEALPVEPWDVPLHNIVTELDWWPL
jgi:5-formyltetrahydrofolate cyclo-ligase